MKVEIAETGVIHDGPYRLEYVDVSFEAYDGGMIGPVRRLNFERGDSIAALLSVPETDEFVLVEQFRFAAHSREGDGWLIEAVAGRIDDGETPEAALRREVAEELGYELGAVRLVQSGFASPGASTERLFLYLAEIKGRAAGTPDIGEDIREIRMGRSELARLLEGNELRDIKTALLAGHACRG
ncbi:MAG: NUDIX hydrolase [Pacificimonas sp.]|jgi:ADP-ribose pyrophosphatase|nr:NUDIX hydrolase [Pacificimonas sp.]